MTHPATLLLLPLLLGAPTKGPPAKDAPAKDAPAKDTPAKDERAQADAAPAECEPLTATSEASEPTAKTVRVLVLELTTSGGFESSLRTLSQIVAEEAARVSGYEIVSTDEIRSILDAEAQKALLGCDASSCYAEVAGALDAELLVTGAVDAAPDGMPVITLSLLNTRAVVTVNRVSLPWRGDPGLLPEVTRTATQRLVFDREQRPPGQILVEGAPDGATVLVDEIDRTSDAVTVGVPDLEVGPHEVTVLADGFEPATRYALVTSGQKVTIEGALEAKPLWTSWWVWAGAGVAVVAAIGGTAALLAMTGPTDVTINEAVIAPGLGSVGAVKGLQ